MLQNSYNYSSEYLSLCDILATEAANSEALWIFYDVCALARKIYDEAAHVKMRHKKVYDELKRRGSKVSTVLSDAAKVSNIGGVCGNQMARQSSLTRQRSAFRVANQRCDRSPDVSAFVEAAHASLHPDGKASLLDSYSALDQVGFALADLVAFWKDHVNGLFAISSKRGSSRPLDELRASEGRWKSAQPALLTAISSISASSDAVTVNAIEPRKVPDRPVRARTYDSYLSPIIQAPAANGLRLFQRLMSLLGY